MSATRASDKDRAKATWGASPAGTTFGEGYRPGTREFFETVRTKRKDYELQFLQELIPFKEFRGKDVLEVGCGAGFDAIEFIEHGSNYVGIDITPENIQRCLAHLGYYGYVPNVREGDAEHLTFADGLFDVVFSNGVLHHTPDMQKSFDEAYRVLKPGGEFWIILYHKNSVFYWITLVVFDQLLRLGFLKWSIRTRLSMIEFTTGNVHPLVNVYTKGEVRDHLDRSGFSIRGIWVRRLMKEDFPGIRFVQRLLGSLPEGRIDRWGHRFGWYVIARGEKPAARG